MEFQLSFTSNPTNGNFGSNSACGWTVQYNSNFLQMYPNTTTAGWSCCLLIPLSSFTSNWLIFRGQQIPSGSGGIITWEAWDINGVRQYSNSVPYTTTSGSNSPGASVGSTGSQDSSWGFFRLCTTTVPLGSGEPRFADNGNLLEWKFNGTLSDASGRGYTATSSAGTPANPCGSGPCYEATSGQSLVTAVIRATPGPIWGNPPSWRAGTTVGLDGSGSISMDDSGGTPALLWQILSGPSTPVWSSHTAMQPTLTGIVMGDYRVQLVATGSSGGSAIATADIGAVAQDSKGVVVNADPDVDKIFGPMIALGKNPWGWADERAYSDIALQSAYLSSVNYNPPTFATKGTGTIAYRYGGNLAATTLNGSISATATSITVADVTKLDLSTLPATPTDILIENELIRICSASGNTLTVCYDGRGVARGAFTYGVGPTQYPGASHNSGVAVGDSMVTGTGTLFATDSQRAVCPAGVPGPPGLVVYSTGTLTMSAGSAVVTGSGTAWSTGNGVVAGNMIRITATHGGGTAFVTWAVINSVDSVTQLTLSRPAPSDIDGTGFSYKITGPLYGSFEVPIPGTPSVTNIIQNILACESETRLSTSSYFEADAFVALGPITGMHYSYKTIVGVTSFTFQPNYYGTGLAARALYLRSGYGPAKTLADNIDEYWVNDPEVCAGYCWSFGIRAVGGFIGALADKVTNPSTTLSWDHLRQFGTAAAGIVATGNCNIADTRDVGSTQAMPALLALFDTAQQSRWNGILYGNSNSFYAWDQACKGADNSWANAGAYFDATQGTLSTLTSGSTAVVAASGTYAAATAARNGCSGVATGTGTIAAGSDVLTRSSGTFTTQAAPGYQVAVTGTRLGVPFTLITDFRTDSANQRTLGGKWPANADTGTVSWTDVIYPFNTTTFATGLTDTSGLAESFICTYVDPTHVTLNRSWPLTTGSTRYLFSLNLTGFGEQPFMLGGAKSLALQWAALNSDSTIASAFNTELQQASIWMFTTGFDPFTLGPFGGRVFDACEPAIVPSTSFPALLAHSNCAGGLSIDGTVEARELTAESSTSLRGYYASQNSSSAARTWADQQYGALWSKSGYDAGGVYSDARSAGNNIGNSNLSDAYLGSFKWTGFFFGMGMAHQWPAVRLGGVAAPMPRTLSVTCNISSVPNATQCRVTLTKPDGSTVTNTCTTSPCPVTADAREGDHLLEVDYLSASNMVLNHGDAVTVRVP